jgi:hypothetical protein
VFGDGCAICLVSTGAGEKCRKEGDEWASISPGHGREVIQKHDMKHIRTLSTKDGMTCELWYYGKTRVNSYDIVLRITLASETGSIEFFYCNADKQSHLQDFWPG